jgi:hypothetical protein
MVENYVLPQLDDDNENRPSFQNVMFSSFLEYRTMTKSKNPALLSVTRHHHNPLRSTSIFLYTNWWKFYYATNESVLFFSYYITHSWHSHCRTSLLKWTNIESTKKNAGISGTCSLGTKKGMRVLSTVLYSSIKTVFLHTCGQVVRCETLHSQHHL